MTSTQQKKISLIRRLCITSLSVLVHPTSRSPTSSRLHHPLASPAPLPAPPSHHFSSPNLTMFSARALGRIAARTARVAPTYTRAACSVPRRAILQAAPAWRQPSLRAFSTGLRTYEKQGTGKLQTSHRTLNIFSDGAVVDEELALKLESELALEMEMVEEDDSVPLSIKEFMDNSPFKVFFLFAIPPKLAVNSVSNIFPVPRFRSTTSQAKSKLSSSANSAMRPSASPSPLPTSTTLTTAT